MKPDKRQTGTDEAQAMMDEFLARGGTITRCPPGPSDTVVYKHSMQKRRKPPSKPA